LLLLKPLLKPIWWWIKISCIILS